LWEFKRKLFFLSQPEQGEQMNRIPVASSNLAAVGYDSANSVLEITFLDGGIYQYYGVPSQIHAGLMSAGSKGSYFDQYVKKAGYRYSKVG
jgi:hypothetical protein